MEPVSYTKLKHHRKHCMNPLVMYGFCRYVQSWIENREVQSEKANLTILFERYVPVLIEAHRVGRFKMITPIQEVRITTGYSLLLIALAIWNKYLIIII